MSKIRYINSINHIIIILHREPLFKAAYVVIWWYIIPTAKAVLMAVVPHPKVIPTSTLGAWLMTYKAGLVHLFIFILIPAVVFILGFHCTLTLCGNACAY